MDSEIGELESKISKARQIKQAMMQELLTGRIRLIEPPQRRSTLRRLLMRENGLNQSRLRKASVISICSLGQCSKGHIMDEIGKPERETQRRLITLFRERASLYYLGRLVRARRQQQYRRISALGLSEGSWILINAINSAIYKLNSRATDTNKSLYERNQGVYNFLRYGIEVDVEFGKPKETVWLINWKEPTKNHFAIAEEVTLRGGHERRPDLVLYINDLRLARLNSKTAAYLSAKASIRVSPTRATNSTHVSTAQSNLSLRAAIPKACSTARSRRPRSSSSNGKKTKKITPVTSSISTF